MSSTSPWGRRLPRLMLLFGSHGVIHCADSLADLYSKRPWSHNQQHEPHAGSFPVRRHSHLQRCAEMLSSQAHGATLSALLKRVCHLPGFLVLAVWLTIIMTSVSPHRGHNLHAVERLAQSSGDDERKLGHDDGKPYTGLRCCMRGGVLL